MSVSNDPVSTSTIVHAACANSARTGTAVRGDTRARAGKNTPSFAMAYGTRAPTSDALTSALKIDPAMAPAITVSAAGPATAAMAAVATDDDSPTLAICTGEST